MPPKTLNKSVRLPSKQSTESKPKEEDYFGVVEVNVINIESKLETGAFTLIIVYGNHLIGKIGHIHIPSEGGIIDIGQKFSLKITAADNYLMDALLSTPFFFSLLEGEDRLDIKAFAQFGFSAAIQNKVTGQGNLGILPLLTGQVETESYVVLEPAGYQETLFFRRKYSEHPKLLIRLTDIKKTLSSIKLHNIMWLSVESIYNIDASHFMEEADHTFVFPMPATTLAEEQLQLEKMIANTFQEPMQIKVENKKTLFAKKGVASSKKKSEKIKLSAKQILKKTTNEKKEPNSDYKAPMEIKKSSEFDLIQFDRGIYTETPTIDTRKKWASLASINGAPAMTKERVKTDGDDLLSTIPIDIGKKFRKEKEPRIEWNMIRPIWLHEELEKRFKNRILQYGVWPLELLMMGKIYVEPEEAPGKLEKNMSMYKNKFDTLITNIDLLLQKFNEIVSEAMENENEIMTQNKNRMEINQLEDAIQKILFEHERRPKRHKVIATQLKKKRNERKHKDKKIKYLGKENSNSQIGNFSTTKKKEMAKKKLSNKAVTIMEKRAYIAWIDLSPLLSPGCTHLRTAGLLQFFNKEEAITKWGLASTLSADSDEMPFKEKEFSNVWQKDPKKYCQIEGRIEKSKLFKNPTRFLLLLGRLVDLRYKYKPSKDKKTKLREKEATETKDKKSEDEKIKRSKKKKPEELKKKKVRFGNPLDGLSKNRKENQVIISEDFKKDILTSKIRDHQHKYEEKEKGVLKTDSSIRHYKKPNSCFNHINTSLKLTDKSVISSTSECFTTDEETVSSIDLTMFNTSFYDKNKRSTVSKSCQSVKFLTMLQLDSTLKSIGHHKNKSNYLKTKATQTVITSSNICPTQLKLMQQKIDNYKAHYTSHGKNILKNYSDGKKLTQPRNDYSMSHALKSKLIAIINKYGRLKESYKLLQITKGNKINHDFNATKHQYKFETKNLNIKRVEPRHKMWHFGKKFNNKNVKHQILITNVVRKLAVLERKFLLLKRIRLAEMKRIWIEKARDLTPEYFKNIKEEYVFVVIDLKLLKPLVPKPSMSKLELNIKKFVKDLSQNKKQEYYTKDSVGDFKNCIISLTQLISAEYQDYKKLYTLSMNPSSEETEDAFYQYLEKSRAHQIIAESLSQGMTGYITIALGDTIPTREKYDQKKLRYFVGWLYTRLVDEMQSIVNKIIIEGDRSLPESCSGDSPNINCEELYLFAVEAIEEMDYNRAKYYLSKLLEGKNRADPLKWVEYAVIALRIGDYSKALECVKETLAVDIRSKEGLILYAIMLMMEGKFDDAHLFFNALITFYPMFVEGWMAFHVFYLIIENKTGADITLVAGTKIWRDHKVSPPYRPSQLSWYINTLHLEEPGSYLSTAAYFLSFNLYEIAEVCLALELDRSGSKNAAWVYYLSVCHYIQGRYEDSAKHLAKAITESCSYNTDPWVWILLGHNCWQMGMKKCAVQIYLQAFRDEQTSVKYAHITYIRCGYFFLESEQPMFAKQMFLRAVKNLGTPMGWLGLGISFFMEGLIDDAEIALKEANMLDTTLATAWGYLALISLYKLKQDQFLHCFREAKRDNPNFMIENEIESQIYNILFCKCMLAEELDIGDRSQER